MTVAEVFAAIGALTATGASTGDDMILAVSGTTASPSSPPGASTDISNWIVAQAGIKSQNSSLNPETKTTAYIRQGKSDVKTGNQRTISFEWDRIIGDAFQDFIDDFDMKYATGNDALVDYAWINARTKTGEIGQGMLVIDTDANSTPEEPLGGSGSIRKSGAKPIEYTYSATTSYTVTFNSNGGSAVTAQTVTAGGKATEPSPAPTKADSTFGGWYKEDTLTTAWNFSTDTVNANTTLYAKWTS